MGRKKESPSWNYLLRHIDAQGEVHDVEGRIREARHVGVVLLMVCSHNNIDTNNVTRFVCEQGDN